MDSQSQELLLQVNNISYIYDDGTAALNNVSLSVRAGEFIALIGRNGCGKSTLCRLLNGLFLPSSGQVLVAGVDTSEVQHQLLVRANVAMVFQVPDNQIVATVVEQDVAFGPENLGIPAAELRLRVRQSLELVGMWDKREREPHLLSEGEKQLVAVAGALALRPKCLLLDEATSMLDPAAKARVMAIARQVHANGVTVIMATHDMHEAYQAQRIIALDKGLLAFDGPPQTLFRDSAFLHRLGLRPPPAARVAEIIRTSYPALPADLFTPEAVVTAIRQIIEVNTCR